jgi:aminotransferase
MTGWRLGWLICPPALAPIAAALQEPVTSCASTIAQNAAEAALTGDQQYVTGFRDAYWRRRDLLLEELDHSDLLALVPQGTFYALIDIGATGLRSMDFARDLLARQATAVVPGIAFGPSCDHYVRVALTNPDDALREGLRRLRAHVESVIR